MQKFGLLREDYCMKKLGTIYLYGLNERAKISNLEQTTGKPFPHLPKIGSRRENLTILFEANKTDTTKTLLVRIATFPRSRSNNFCRILKEMKRKDLRKLASNTTDELKIHEMILKKDGDFSHNNGFHYINLVQFSV